MKSKNLLIVFAKNIMHGKVKTRLAKTIGDDAAFDVYAHLVEITERESNKMTNCDVHIYFSDAIINTLWPNKNKYVQRGNDLGERMMNAFQDSFDQGYEHVIGVGADLPDLTIEIMTEGLEVLNSNDSVFGPSEDGGYYLIGMNALIPCIFTNKPWSTNTLLDLTMKELKELNYSTQLLKELNDVDTIEDLKKSSIVQRFQHLLTNNTKN
ncbi:MAG: TIGR04282 family arsenosugar biosynthesis glycosyltransferase [Crocinitomicaceae bacterium]|nr:TIGR04282 family arsenosugar biosynthesis glycosyltransferase [Crocinitomicaceae bacterium]